MVHLGAVFVLGSESDLTHEPISLPYGLAVAFSRTTNGAQSFVCGFASMQGTNIQKVQPRGSTDCGTLHRSVIQRQERFVCSEAKLNDVCTMTSYAREVDSQEVTGLVFEYGAAPPAIVGEARYKRRSWSKAPSDPFTRITADYEPYMHGRRLVGLQFDLESGNKWFVGRSENSSRERMAVRTVSGLRRLPDGHD